MDDIDVKEFIKTTVDQIVVLFNAFVDLAKRIWEKHGADIMAVVSKAFDVISAVIKTAMDIIKNVIKIATGLIKGDWGQVWEGIKGLFKSIIDGSPSSNSDSSSSISLSAVSNNSSHLV